MIALITGAGGFLGEYLTELLVAQGVTVRSYARGDYPRLRAMGVQMVQGDLRDAAAVQEACRGVDIVYHTAGVAGIWGPWSHYHGINTLGTEHILAGCRAHGVPRLVYTSSPSVTFDGGSQQNVDESAPYPQHWLCHYPHSKALAEQAVLAANDPPRLMTCSLRPHLIWGPRDQHLIPRLIQRAQAGALRQVGDGSNRVDMIYVENAATAHLQAAAALQPGSPVCGQAYFLSQDAPVNCWDWINEILQLAGVAPVSKRISFKAAWRIGAAMETAWRLFGITSEPRMTRFLAAQLATDHYFDIRRAKQDFGYRPVISTDEGMRRLAAAMQTS
ncbi:NAD-dependent epimerase/dehydratase family protein [Lignipirellula cremea]|uniref:3 beta-hydroxysteroid dehydrogenase/Delta 5-->4-isomerase n=1 Tax=Lignipirellula cremea TaxID=2528010 RepID=A0A518E1E3_9BACT|nr:NAD-dependent epimerase/dehydratase family protein [Lignipirellula cremea]QDU97915.1 3 beta-hydroxysteroid dehydrogenase/Delta 5-->4-isomerase [Lignipirellula cremea]